MDSFAAQNSSNNHVFIFRESSDLQAEACREKESKLNQNVFKASFCAEHTLNVVNKHRNSVLLDVKDDSSPYFRRTTDQSLLFICCKLKRHVSAAGAPPPHTHVQVDSERYNRNRK